MKINKQIKNHLESCGYAMIPDNEDALFMKPGIPNTYVITGNRCSIEMRGLLRSNDIAKHNEYDFLQYINSLNLNTEVVTFLKGEGCLCFHATYVGLYDRREFGRFVHFWENDLTTLLDNTWETRCYLSKEFLDDVPDYRCMVPVEKCLA